MYHTMPAWTVVDFEASSMLCHCLVLSSASQNGCLGCLRLVMLHRLFRLSLSSTAEHTTLGCLRLVVGCLSVFIICITECQSGLFHTETIYRLFHHLLLPSASQHASLDCFTLRLVTGCSLFPVTICITACQSGLFHTETSYRLFIVSCYHLHHSMPV